ncbi:MAG: M3 family metallopeptidase, partial [Myxococcota bacterium]
MRPVLPFDERAGDAAIANTAATMFGSDGDPRNPLLEMWADAPDKVVIPFDQIAATHVQPAVEVRLQEARDALAAIAADSEPRTYDNTLAAMDRATEPLGVTMTAVGHLESVCSSPELREVYNQVQPEVSAFYAGIPLDEGLYAAVKSFAQTDAAAALTGARKRHLEKTLDYFRRHGAELDADGKTRLRQISRRLAEVTSKFAQNVVDSTAAYELIIEDESRLKGLPESARSAARQAAEEKGKKGWRFTLHGPSYVPAMMYLADADIRQQLYRAYNTRASSGTRDNAALIVEILQLRTEQAGLLGYENFGDFVLEPRMAKSAQTAVDFVDRLRKRSEASFKAENAALLAFRRAREGAEAPPLEPWDVGYYAELQRRDAYDFDDEQLRPFFSLDGVMNGLFETVQRLFGVTVRPAELPVWHQEVRVFEICDGDGTRLGAFYADLHPRDTKRGGAWMNALLTGLPGTQSGPHLGLICANLARPVGDKPALLNHEEVSTLFHEFGHLLHHMLS